MYNLTTFETLSRNVLYIIEITAEVFDLLFYNLNDQFWELISTHFLSNKMSMLW